MLDLLADTIFLVFEETFMNRKSAFSWAQIVPLFSSTSQIDTSMTMCINDLNFENILCQMNHAERESDMTESNNSASYLDVLLSIGRNGQLCTSLHDKLENFNLHIINCPFLSINIPSPAYGIFISQLIWYARACPSYECFILRVMWLFI